MIFINNVQVMLLLSGRVSEKHFLAIWRPKFQGFSLWCPSWGHFTEIMNKANGKETESLGENGGRQKCWDKSLSLMLIHNLSAVMYNFTFHG